VSMSVSVQVIVDRRELDALSVGRMKPAVIKALRRAGSTALRDMRSELSKRVRARKRIKAAAIREALRLRRAQGSDIDAMEWAIDVSGKAMRVADYPHRQTKRGVSVEINRGQRSLIRGAFVATMKSGHKGVFVRRGRRRLPIDERFGSRVVDALGHQGEVEAIQRRGQSSFQATFKRMLGIELQKLHVQGRR
jgi:hypothetical protein